MAENNQDESREDGRQNQGRKSSRGFASMDPEKQRQIASKGGQAVSENRQHMAEIGRKGGEASGESRSNNSNAASRGGNTDSPEASRQAS